MHAWNRPPLPKASPEPMNYAGMDERGRLVVMECPRADRAGLASVSDQVKNAEFISNPNTADRRGW
jgi:hypothetical protein